MVQRVEQELSGPDVTRMAASLIGFLKDEDVSEVTDNDIS